MRNKDLAAKHIPTVIRLLENSRYEVLPTPTIEEKIHASLPTSVPVTVTASPTKGLEQTLATAERLAAAGYKVVPHIAARMVHDRAELEEITARMKSAGVTDVFVPGGDAEAAGIYPDALALLKDLRAIGDPFGHVGIAGYPESHPTIHDDVTIQTMWDKRDYSTHVVSNMTFGPAAVSNWLQRMRLRGIKLPLLLGLPGPIDRAKLLGMATKIGVGDSTRFLKKHVGLMARLTAPGGFTGERFLAQCAPTFGDPESVVEGLHLYTFNQVAETEQWRTELLARLKAR
ncbi:methylenetetrahydrofolate reductase [Actinomycetota bacterium]